MKELQFLIYRAENDQEKASVIVGDETIWASQKEMARLFDVGVPAISKYLKNIFEEGELDEHSVISKMETTASDGKNYLTAITISMSSFPSVIVSILKRLLSLGSGQDNCASRIHD